MSSTVPSASNPVTEATFDIETNGLYDESTVVHCLSILDHSNEEVFHYGPDDIDNGIKRLGEYEHIFGHNCIDFDLPVLRKLHSTTYRARVTDTLLLSRLLYPNRQLHPLCKGRVGPHSVENWAHYLGTYKQEHEDWSTYSVQMQQRNIQDVKVQRRIQQALKEKIDADVALGFKWDLAIRLTMQLYSILERQERRGWYIDLAHLEHCLELLGDSIDDIDRTLDKQLPLVTVPGTLLKKNFKQDGTLNHWTKKWLSEIPLSPFKDTLQVVGPFTRVDFRPVSLDKPQEVKDLLLEQGWEPREWNYDKATGERRGPKLSKDDPFDGITGELGKLASKRTQAKQRKGTIQGWLDCVRSDGTISGRVNGLATTARAKHSVIVNVPGSDAFFGPEMRAIFRARPGWKMVGVDSKGNQNRQLAARMDDEEFRELAVSGRDVHEANRQRVKLPTRTVAKNFFYGCILFGAGLRKTAKIAGCPEEKAGEYKQAFFKEMPKLKDLIDRLKSFWRRTAKKRKNKWGKWEYQNGLLKALDGRPLLVENEKDLLCYTLQSDEAIQMQAAYCWFYQEAHKRGYEWDKDWAYLIWMHDEFQFECRPEIAQELCDLGCEAIAWAGRFYKINCPHEGDGKIGNNWSETH